MMPMMLEAALRSLLVAAAVAAGLRLLRVRNVLAQKSAWTLVLAAALAMPLLQPLAARWQVLPAAAAFTLPQHPFSGLAGRLASLRHHPAASAAVPRAFAATPLAAKQEPAQIFTGTSTGTSSLDGASSVEDSGYLLSHSSANTDRDTPGAASPAVAASARPALSLADLASLAYLAVAITLLLRLFVGLASALLIWMAAVPVTLSDRAGLAEGISLRASREVASPVTVGSAVILPADYGDWEIDKLRIVLAHERSHIRQRDFYLQSLAGLYTAIVWFSPLGWWLKRTLSDLAETISDRAGLEQAADSSSYAQILLEFAAAPRLTLTGVAMARPGSLSRRIERLLNESSFSQAFAGGRGRLCVAVLLVPIALFAATSLIRVKAAQDAPPPAPAAPVTPQAQTAPAPPAAEAPATGQAAPESDVDSVAPPAPDAPILAPPAAEAAPSTRPGAIAPPAPDAASVPVTPAAPADRVIVVPKVPGHVIVLENIPRRIVVPEVPAITIHVPDTARILAQVQREMAMSRTSSSDSSHNGWAHSSYFDNGDYYAVITGKWDNPGCCTWMRERRATLEKIRAQAHGDFLWFNHGGKDYFIDDPATLARIEAQYKSMEDLGRQQEALGRQQEELGRQQEALGQKQEQASVTAPDISKEMAELNAAMAALQAKKGQAVTQEQLADLQEKLGDLQGRLGDLQGSIGDRMGALGAQQGKLGEQMGRLGAEQGRLGAMQGNLSRDADRMIRSVIDESLSNGKAHPVQ